MPIWLKPVIDFVGVRFIHFIVYALLALLCVGIPYKLFWKDTNKYVIKDGGIINNCDKEVPLVGCSIFRVKLKAIWQ